MVRNYKKVEGPHKSHGRVDEFTRDRVVRLLEAGWKRSEICKETGISTSQCRRYRAALQQHGAIHAPRRKKPGPPPKDPEKARLRDLQQPVAPLVLTTPLSHHLLAHGAPAFLLHRATHHPFLAAAGAGSLPSHLLRRWLAQDMLYTRAYTRFIGSLISKLSLPNEIHAKTKYGTNGMKCIPHRCLDLLIGALTNIQREMEFFENTARGYGLKLEELTPEERNPHPTTIEYIRLFDSFSIPHHEAPGLLEGLVVLWATEYCYLQAWSYAKTFSNGQVLDAPQETPLPMMSPERPAQAATAQMQSIPPPEPDSLDLVLDPQVMASAAKANETVAAAAAAASTALDEACCKALYKALIPNWTSPEFGKFVEECRDVLDDMAKDSGIRLENDGLVKEKHGALQVRRLENYFHEVVNLEQGFWPHIPGPDELQEALQGLQ